jgi:hypothetical protein
MMALKLSSDWHQGTPVDIFVYEPCDFVKEHGSATTLEVAPDAKEKGGIRDGWPESSELP